MPARSRSRWSRPRRGEAVAQCASPWLALAVPVANAARASQAAITTCVHGGRRRFLHRRGLLLRPHPPHRRHGGRGGALADGRRVRGHGGRRCDRGPRADHRRRCSAASPATGSSGARSGAALRRCRAPSPSRMAFTRRRQRYLFY
ncbi:MAG: hypothetical protein ACLTDR_04510 [Adlercreutzia equolifaciens]